MDTNEKNPFQKLETHEELSENLKNKVMSTVNLGILVKDFAELFTARAGQTALELFKGEVLKDASISDLQEQKESKGSKDRKTD